MPVSNGIIFTIIYDKRDHFDFDIVNFQLLDGDVSCATSYDVVYISQVIRFARASSQVSGFNNRNKILSAKLVKQGYCLHEPFETFSKFYHRHSELN